MAIKVYKPNKVVQRGGDGDGTKETPFYWYGNIHEGNNCVVGYLDNSSTFNDMNYTAESLWVRVYLDAGTEYVIGQTVWDAISLYSEDYEVLVKKNSGERELNGCYCYYCLTFTPEYSGVYLLKTGITNGYPEQYRVAMNVAPNAIDAVPEVYDYQLTSEGFNPIGKYQPFFSLSDAGLQPLSDNKLLCRFTFDGDDPLTSTNGKYSFPSGFSLVDSANPSLGKAMSFDRNCPEMVSNIPVGSFLNDTDFTIMFWIKTSVYPNWNICGGGSYDLFRMGLWGNFASISNSDNLPYVSIGASQDDNDYSNPTGIWRSTIEYPIGEWWHFCYVYKDGTIYYYQNGKLALKVTPSFTIKEYRQPELTFKFANVAYIGNNIAKSNTYCIDDFRIYKRAVFTEDFAPPLD